MNAFIKTNERELAQKVIEWFGIYLPTDGIPFNQATGEAGVLIDKTTRFGDVVLWKNRSSLEVFAYIELKKPFAAKEDLETFREKAIQYKALFALTWDFQNLVTYRVEKNKLKPEGTQSTPVLNNINEWLRGDKQALIRNYIQRISSELISLHETGKFQKFRPEKIYFVNFIHQKVNQLIPVYENFISEKCRNKLTKEAVLRYASEQAIAFPNEKDYYQIIARQSSYALITKIVFYLTLRRSFKDLPDLLDQEEENISKLMKLAFIKARDIDWQAIFEESPIEALGIPEAANEMLLDLFSELRVYQFAELSEDVIGQLFEEIIEPDQRHLLGQYFTREDLVDFVIATIVDSADGVYLDPTCGSGTFLMRLYDRIKYLKRSKQHTELLDQIWGIDIGKFPAELATVNLYRQQPGNFENFPRVRNIDIFDVSVGKTFDFPPNHRITNFEKIKVPFPYFDGIVGNFPYIRQELIEKKVKGFKKELTKLLAQEYFISYPQLFDIKFNGDHFEELKKYPEEKLNSELDRLTEENKIGLYLSGQADIYAYIYLHTATFLKEGGSFAIITSNSYLDTGYGTVLKQFMLDHFKIKFIIGSWAEPWFEDAAVNTVITVLEKCADVEERKNNLTHFVKLKKQFKDLIPYRDLKLESIKRWDCLDRLVNKMIAASSNRKKKIVTDAIHSLETDEMRIRMIKQNELQIELNKKPTGAKWGKYLRAPDVYFEILNLCGDKLVPLKNVAQTRRGFTTGINDFFYLEPIEIAQGNLLEPSERYLSPGIKVLCKNARGWQGEIESMYLRKIIKSPREVNSIEIKPDLLKYFQFVCNKSKKELNKIHHFGALKYIEWGETQVREDGIKWTDVPSVTGREYWWSIGHDDVPDIIFPAGIGEVYKVFSNSAKIWNDKRLYEVYSKDHELLLPLLNSSFYSFMLESEARVSLGEGLFDLTVYEVEDSLIPNIDFFKSKNISGKMDVVFSKIRKRNIKPIFEEVKQKDRKELDTIILTALGLNPKEFLPRIYEGICEMVSERLELPKMRKKQKATSVKFAYDEIKQSVIKDCIAHNIKKFPENFYSGDPLEFAQEKFKIINSTGKPLHIDNFMGHYQIKDESENIIHSTDNHLEAEYVLLYSKNKSLQIRIPEKNKVVETILKNYRSWVKNLQDQIEENANHKLHNWSLSEKMTNEILDEYGLKN